MIEQTAIVISVEQGYAWVTTSQRGGSCGACSAKSPSCSSRSLFEFWRNEPRKLRVLNPLHARPGDTVVVGVQSDALLWYSLLAYLLPLVSMIVFAILGSEMFRYLDFSAELGSILGGASGLLGGFRFAGLLALRTHQSSGFQPVILRKQGPSYIASPIAFSGH